MPAFALDTAAVTRCFTDAWHYMVGQYPDHLVARIGPVAVILAQTNCPFFNMIAIDAPTANAAALRQALATARGYADRCPHDALLLLAPDWLPEGADAVLAEAGAGFSMSLVGMATDRLTPARRDEPALDYRLVRDEATAIDLGRVNAEAYGLPESLFALTGNLHTWSGSQFGVVGYADGEPVTATHACLLGDCIYIAMVATLRAHHGKGYGEAVMRRAIAAAEAAVGEKPLWLHATEMGQPVYRAMGFDAGARLDLYGFA